MYKERRKTSLYLFQNFHNISDQMILEKDGLKQEINESKIVLRDLNNTQGQIINRI